MFERAKFKQEFVLMNQKATQKATSPVERDFQKLLNDANFGNDCRNNIDNSKLEPIYDEIGEISYIKKFHTIFGNDDNYREFYFHQIMRDEVIQKYNALVLGLHKNDATYEAKKQWYQAKKEVGYDSIDSLQARWKKTGKNKIFRYRYQDRGGYKLEQDKNGSRIQLLRISFDQIICHNID